MLGSIYMVVADYMRKAGCEIIDGLKKEQEIKKERERIDAIYKEEIKRFYFKEK